MIRLRKSKKTVLFALLLFSILAISLIPLNKQGNIFNTNIKNEKEPAHIQENLKTQGLSSNNIFTGIGSPWNITHWANRTDNDLEVSFSNGSSDTASIPLGEGWEGYKLNATIKNLYDSRNWINGTFEYGTDDAYLLPGDDSNYIALGPNQNWTFSSIDVGGFTNLMAGNYLDTTSLNPNTLGHDCLELCQNGSWNNPYSGYDLNDECSWSTTFPIPRGGLIDATLQFDLNPLHIADFDSWNIEIDINGQQVYSIGVYTLKKFGLGLWHTITFPLSVWSNTSNVFPSILDNSWHSIEIRLRTSSDGNYAVASFPNVDYQQVLIDNIELTVEAKALPSQINLKMNNTDVSDIDWSEGTIELEGNWKNTLVLANFSSTDTPEFGAYQINLDTDLNLYTIKESQNTTYEADSSSIGMKFTVSNNTNVDWEGYSYLAVPTAYKETMMSVRFPSDVNINWVSSSVQPSVNITDQCDILTPGLLLIPVNDITATPNGYWKINAESPNYCEDLITYNNKTGSWINEDIFLSGDYINFTGKIINSAQIAGHITQTSATLQIRFPNGSIWTNAIQSKSPDASGNIYFDAIQIPISPPDYEVGEYNVIITWDNSYSSYGANESGIIYTTFTVTHDSKLTPEISFYPNIAEDSVVNLKVSFNDEGDNSAIENAQVYTFNFTNPGVMQNFSEISPGYYLLEFNVNGAVAGNNTMTIYANSTLFTNNQVNVTLFIVKDTILNANATILTIPWNHNFSIQFNYTEKNSGIWIDATPINDWLGETYTIQIAQGQYILTCNTSVYEVNKLYSLVINIDQIGYISQSILIKVEIIERVSYINDIFINGINRTTEKSLSLTSGELLNITVKYRDALLAGQFIENASVKAIGGSISQVLTENLVLQYYNISLNTTQLGIGITFLTISAQKKNYTSNSVVLTITVSERGTSYALFLNGQNKTATKTIQLLTNQTLNITFTFKDYITQTHISGATVELLGAYNGNFTDNIALSHYNYSLNTTLLNEGVNFLTIFAQKTGYDSKSILFTVEIIKIETKLELYLNGTEKTLDRSFELVTGADLNVTITFKNNNTGNHIDLASVRIVGEGIDANLTEDGSAKQYWIIVNATNLNWGVNFLTVFAEKSAYKPQTITIKIEVINKQTCLDLFLESLNKTDDIDKSIALNWNENLNITVMYKDTLTGSNINTALVELNGTSYSNIISLNGQQFTIEINTTILGLGTHYFSITASETDYDSQSISFKVIIKSRVSQIEDFFINSQDISFLEIPWNENLNITVIFKDVSTGNHITSATININGTAIGRTLTEYLILQQYAVNINSAELVLGVNYLTISAQEYGYTPQSVSLTIKVISRETCMSIFLDGVNKTQDPFLELPIGDTFNITIKFNDNTTGAHITGAIIQLSGEGLSELLTESVILQQYSIIIDTRDLDIGNKFLTIYASLSNHTELSEVIKITVRRIQAEIRTETASTVFNIQPGQSFTLTIILNDTDNNVPITGALVKYTWALGQGELEEVGNGIYQIQFDNVPEGSYSITITVYAGDDYDFERFVVSLNVVMPAELTLMYQIITIVAISATIAIGGYLIAYQKFLKYPVPVRKVRKYRNNYKKKFVKADIIHREDAFNSLYLVGLGGVAKMLKGKVIAKTPITEAKEEELKKPTKDIQAEIASLEKQIKKTMKTDGIKGTEMMLALSKLYKEIGEDKKARYLFEKQKTLRIQLLHELREDVLKVAQNAEKENNWEVAADHYSQAKNLSTKLLDEGRMMEAEQVKKYSSLEKKARNQIEKGKQ